MSTTTLRDGIVAEMDARIGALTDPTDIASRQAIALAFATAIYGDAAVMGGAGGVAATPTALGLVKLAGAPTDAANPAVYPTNVADARFLALAGGTLTGALTTDADVDIGGGLSTAGGIDVGASLSFGTRAGQHVNIWGSGYALGVQSNTLYARSDSNFAWFQGGTHNDGQYAPGSGGQELLRLSSAEFKYLGNTVITTANIATYAPAGGGSTTDASALTTGTLADARLSTNIPKKNATNSWTTYQELVWGASSDWALALRLAADSSAYRRFVLTMLGRHEWGDGASSRDTNLYRSAASTLTTDGTFIAGMLKQGSDAVKVAGDNWLTVADTRATNATPTEAGLNRHAFWEFKQTSAISIPNPGTGDYAGLLTVSPWNDDSGGGLYQLGFTKGGYMALRYGERASGWGSWKTLVTTTPFTNYTNVGSRLFFGSATGPSLDTEGTNGNFNVLGNSGGVGSMRVNSIVVGNWYGAPIPGSGVVRAQNFDVVGGTGSVDFHAREQDTGTTGLWSLYNTNGTLKFWTPANADRLTLDGAGNLVAQGTISGASDARLKQNVTAITGALTLVRALRGVRFERIDSGEANIGLIAQEVEALVPEAVRTNAETGMKSVAYGNLVGLLVAAVSELAALVESH